MKSVVGKHNPLVVGSNPTEGTIRIKEYQAVDQAAYFFAGHTRRFGSKDVVLEGNDRCFSVLRELCAKPSRSLRLKFSTAKHAKAEDAKFARSAPHLYDATPV